MKIRATFVACVFLLIGCNGPSPSAATAPTTPGSATSIATATSTATAAPGRSIDPARVEAATGIKPDVTDGVAKVSSPRTEKVEVDGWAMPPFMGLTSWAAFTPGEKLGIEAMV